jgi:hypothetical protein
VHRELPRGKESSRPDKPLRDIALKEICSCDGDEVLGIENTGREERGAGEVANWEVANSLAGRSGE